MVNDLGKLLHDNVVGAPPDDDVDIAAVVQAGHRRVRARRTAIVGGAAVLVVGAVASAAALAGLGSDTPPPADGPDGPATPVSVITDAQAGRIKAKMSQERVQKLLGDPLLTQEPFDQFPGGCFYYAMENRPAADVWQFCFNDQGVSVVLTAFSPTQPSPPDGASYARSALIARADAVCQGQDGYLATITADVGRALGEFGEKANRVNTDALAREVGRFADNLEDTHQILAAFDAPADEHEALTSYLDALTGQVGALTLAQQAIVDRDLEAYERYGNEFNDLGEDARTAAQDYGFITCSAPDWG